MISSAPMPPEASGSNDFGKQGREGSVEKADNQSTPARHPTLWFEDGTIVLIAENVAFKVHRGVLARQSPVFHDMFGVPQPQEEETFEGCSLVHLHDPASDLAIFIEVLYDGFKFRRTTSWPVLQALLLLSQKYGAEDIRKEALFQLELIFPKTVDEWDSRLDHSSKAGTIHTRYDPAVDCIAAVNTARILGTRDVQAAALYDCCQLTPEKLVMGVVREDGRRDRLSEEDLAFCIRAIAHYIQFKHYVMNKVGHTSSKSCRTPIVCDTARVIYFQRINDPREVHFEGYCLFPSVMSKAEWLEPWLAGLGTCAACIKSARRSLNEARRVFMSRIYLLDSLSPIR